MSIALKQYSSGYRSISGHVTSSVDLTMFRIENVRSGDPELVQLLHTVQLNRLSNVSSDHKLQLIDCAKRLFGNFDTFVQYNVLSNNLVHGKVLDFLIDTVEFIDGGIRELSVETWTNYLDQVPKKPSQVPDRRNVTLNLTGPNYIAKWIRQPNGFADLVSTLILMFGIRLPGASKSKNGLI